MAWLSASVVSSLYAFVWDIRMDWGLLEAGSDNFLLREEIVYDKPVRIRRRVFHR